MLNGLIARRPSARGPTITFWRCRRESTNIFGLARLRSPALRRRRSKP
jgi:hypothetical protein